MCSFGRKIFTFIQSKKYISNLINLVPTNNIYAQTIALSASTLPRMSFKVNITYSVDILLN